jgi:3-(3-hydroxy-phenyl)propionate hydroxylase
VDRIQELGHVELRWNNRVTAFAQDADGATLSVTTPAGDYQLRADHVIDATGSRSPFRQWCKASVTAKKGDDRWCIADVRFTKHPPVERHTWIEAPFNENRAVWQHLMGDDVWRIDYQMAPNADPDEVSREDVVRERLARQFGPDTGVEIVWVGPYAYRSECVDQMRHGRVFLMGDSAKVVSPFGARGGNTGIADADNLAWKLAAVLRGQASPAVLDSYHQERHEASTENVLVTNRTARFPAAGDPRRTPVPPRGHRAGQAAPVCPAVRQHRAHGRGQHLYPLQPVPRHRGPVHAERSVHAGPTAARGWSTTCCSGLAGSCCCWSLAG